MAKEIDAESLFLFQILQVKTETTDRRGSSWSRGTTEAKQGFG